jgi:hypothetical protein
MTQNTRHIGLVDRSLLCRLYTHCQAGTLRMSRSRESLLCLHASLGGEYPRRLPFHCSREPCHGVGMPGIRRSLFALVV